MKPISSQDPSTRPQRRHVETQLKELAEQYEQLSTRIAALDNDIGRELDSERRLVLEQRRQERSDERDRISAQITHIEKLLAEPLIAVSSEPLSPVPSMSAPDNTVLSRLQALLHQYPSHLTIGIGIVAVLLLVLVIRSAFWPRPEVITPTESPTKGDVIITELDGSKATRRYEFARRLEQDLKKRLTEYGLSNVSVTVLPEVISSAEEARKLAKEAGGKAIIWGWYDDLDVGVRVELLEEAQISDLTSTTQLPLLQVGEGEKQLAVVVRDVLPQNVSFLSLYVIGHLNYLANNYESGHRAFDAAMNAMPAEARLENEALLHFFNARKLEDSDAPVDVIATVCGYANAIQADPTFAASYNNLANIVSRRFVLLTNGEWSSMPDAVVDCLQRIGVYDDDRVQIPVRLYDEALRRQPGWALAEYNKAGYIWNQSEYFECPWGPEKVYYCLTDPNPLVGQLSAVLDKDATLGGAHIILGNLAFENDEFQVAREHYQQALTTLPNDARLRFNLAQTMRKLGDPEASKMYEQTLVQDEINYEAALALAALAYQKEKTSDAFSLLRKIPAAVGKTESLSTPEAMAYFLRAALSYKDGKLTDCIDQLESLVLLAPEESLLDSAPEESLLRYLLSLLYDTRGDADAAQRHRAQAEKITVGIDPSLYKESFFRAGNMSIGLGWFEIMMECGSDGLESDCLPKDTGTRIRSLFDRVVENFGERLYYSRGTFRSDLALGAACPRVYTIDPATGEWQMETTILYHLVGPAQEQMQPRLLQHFDGRLLIREEEPEVSYINRLYILIEDRNGQLVRLEAAGPQAEALLFSDDHYLVLKPGDMVELNFPAYDPERYTATIQVVAEGYYDPLH